MMKKIGFLTTIFPENRDYLKEFFNSIKNQTYKDFDLIVVNDGYENFDEIKKNYTNLDIIELMYSSSPAKNREHGINYCINNEYDILIFGDSDDYFANNRVEKSIEFLENNDVVVNDLSLFDSNGIYKNNYISNRLENNFIVNLDFIKNKNIFGLSNTAISLDHVSMLNIPSNLIAVDWYIFSLLLLSNKKAIFTNETTSYYRQYTQNTVGFKELDIASLKQGIKIKKIHFQNLSKITNIFDKELERILKRDFRFNDIEIYNPLWWELI